MNTEEVYDICLQQARQFQGSCAPNPAVGAVIVRNGKVVAVGCHHGPGTPHAEVEAIRQLDALSDLADTTLYVTLEPCCHVGRTPPCTDLIIERGIRHVVFAHMDPNPQVAGQGMARLQAAGISCEFYPDEAITRFYRAYDYWWRTHLPWVQLKLAMSSNGKIAAKNKQPVQITGEEVRNFTHQMRLNSDVLLTTAATIINDDPLFTVRLNGMTQSKIVAILDTTLSLTVDSKVFQSAEQVLLFYDCKQAAEQKVTVLKAHGVECIAVDSTQGRLDLKKVLLKLAEIGYHSCWVEVGAQCFAALMQSGCVNQCYLYVSDLVLDAQAYGLQSFSSAPHLRYMHWLQKGKDAILLIES